MDSSTSGNRTKGRVRRRGDERAQLGPCLPGMPDAGAERAETVHARASSAANPLREVTSSKRTSSKGTTSKRTASRGTARKVGPKLTSGRSLLFGTPREVLARISAGDPLGIRSRIGAYLRDRHLLFDADRLHLRALAHTARQALRLRATDGLDAFLTNRIADAARELQREDRAAVKQGGSRVRSQVRGQIRSRAGSQAGSQTGSQAGGMVGRARPSSRERKARTSRVSSGDHFDELARPLGLKPDRVRVACAEFNEAEAADRKACFELLVAGADIDSLASAETVTVTEIARRARRALEVALCALEGEAS